VGGVKAALLDATMLAVRGGDTRLSTLSRPERGPAATASCDVTQPQDLGRAASPPGCCRANSQPKGDAEIMPKAVRYGEFGGIEMLRVEEGSARCPGTGRSWSG